MSDEPDESWTRQVILQAMVAVLSDDHNHERGVTTLTELIDRVASKDDGTSLSDVAVTLSLALAHVLEQIAADQGLAAEDLVELWFAE